MDREAWHAVVHRVTESDITDERLLNQAKTPGFLAPGEEEFKA